MELSLSDLMSLKRTGSSPSHPAFLSFLLEYEEVVKPFSAFQRMENISGK
jgi:hypothetical protein